MKRFSSLLIVALLVIFSNSAWAYVISANKTGGDCTLIGTWNGKSRTCSLTTDIVSDSNNRSASFIEIGASGVTVEGNGHTLDGSAFRIGFGNEGDHLYGVVINSRMKNVTIKNLKITGYTAGIVAIRTSVNITLDGNILTGNSRGITMAAVAGAATNHVVSNNTIMDPVYNGTQHTNGISISGEGNVISGNTIAGAFHAIFLLSSGSNTITGNTLTNNENGIAFGSGGGAIRISGNTISGSGRSDILADSVHSEVIYNNNFLSSANITRSTYPTGYTPSEATVNQPLPTGGNYWANYDTPEEGCYDDNLDGICDIPYLVNETTVDNLPWTTQNGWPVDSGGSGGGDSGDGGSTKGGGKGGGGGDSGDGGSTKGGGKPTR